MKVYAAYYDNSIRIESSSGGVFSLLASKFDVIYGVKMDNDNRYAVFARKIGDISELRGSKYIQAKVGDTFQQVKEDLIKGKKVLFSGTACQVNGLLCFLQKNYDNLFTIDVVCHGVPTPRYWHKYIESKTVKCINFRAKDGGWDNYTYGMRINDTYIPHDQNKYMILYVKDYMLRPSCYECINKQSKRSDITLGDFWGIEKIDFSMTDNKGTSLVITRTEKGQSLFDIIKSELIWKEFSYEDGVRQNPSEYKSSERPTNRDDFFRDMDRMSFPELFNKYCPKMSLQSKIIHKLYRFLKG